MFVETKYRPLYLLDEVAPAISVELQSLSVEQVPATLSARTPI
jgi:ATP:corrinoid adenosyltransferase